MSREERLALLKRYEKGPALLRASLERMPAAALQWRPGPAKWSAHEVMCHCADSETVASTRIRFLLAEERPTIVGYEQDRWALTFDYHALPMDLALRQIEQVREWTSALLRRLPDAAWSREGMHTESGRYTAEGWLSIYAEHLEAHSRQLDRNLTAWNARGG